MTDADALCHLHLRLILDDRSALTVAANGRVTPTPAGKLWLRDHARYEHLRRTLERDKGALFVPALLKERFGYVLETEIVPTESGSEAGPTVGGAQ